MASESRVDMVATAAALIGARGRNATSFAEVLAESGAPRGSIYHHFPKGKEQLTNEAIELVSQRLLAYVRSGPTDTPEHVLAHFIDLWRRVVAASNGAAGCAVAGVAVDTNGEPLLMRHVRDIFRSWVSEVAGRLETAGMSRQQSVATARTALAAMEGALILCRAEGSVEPLNDVAEQLLRLVQNRPSGNQKKTEQSS
jgi:TetR/AcrR family transcriptional regulator, lmrAB and yxaGH operons repressor